MLKLLVKDEFAMAHQIPGHPKCGRIHGHNFKVEVIFECLASPEENGMVVDFAILKEIVQNITQGEFDHQFIKELKFNDEDKESVPSAENLAQYIAKKVIAGISERKLNKKIMVKSVKVCETDRFCAILEFDLGYYHRVF